MRRKLLATMGVIFFTIPVILWFYPQLINQQQLLWATLIIGSMVFIIIAFCLNIREQVEDNPYYVDMIKAKREQVRLSRKLAKMAVNK